MSGRSGETAEKPICVTGLGRSMGDVLQPLEMLGPEVVQAEIKKTGIPVHRERLENVLSTPYLAVCLSETLKWEAHINTIMSKVNSTLSFLRRNLKACPPKLRETAYLSLVRSSLEYSSAVWNPFRQKDIDKLEKNQRAAARFVTQNYRQTASVTSLIQNLGWTDLKTRRNNSKLLCMFKILNELVEIHINDRLIPADRRARGGHNQAYKHIRANTTLGQNSFWHRTIPDWNSLPAAAVESKTGSIQESAGRLDLPASSPLQPDTPQWRAAGVFTQSQSICVFYVELGLAASDNIPKSIWISA